MARDFKMKQLKHYKIVKELVEKYKKDPNVVGIYIFGSLAKGTVKPSSDIDIEIVMRQQKGKYKLLHPNLDKDIHVDLSLPREDSFIKDFEDYPYLNYAALDYKILSDPNGILKKSLESCKRYFKNNPKVLKFWRDEEKKWKEYKKNKYTKKKKTGAKNYFDIMKELKKNKGELK
jgi:predicted nucleotidyltransferase